MTTDWLRLAGALAKDAHDNHFDTGRGVWHIKAANVIVVFNNHPYTNSPTLRDEETAEFRKRLAAAGLKELGFATYGDQDMPTYTFAMVIDAGQDRLQWAAETMRDIIVVTLRRAMATSMANPDAND